MKHMARCSWVNAINAGGIQYLYAPRQYQELCSIPYKDNWAHFENTQSPTPIISKGFLMCPVILDRKSTRLNSSH